ncbi:MAG: DUF4831 family protein [Bacteroidaceae bacterium]|nr:DUF4831 family protein [Bacteroidaceae bacterium]
MTRLSNLRAFCCLASAALSLWTGASAQSRPTEPSVSATGVSYLLPRTKITAKVQVIHSICKPGELSRYAERYLRLSGVNTQYSQQWEIKGIDILIDGAPDTETIYSIEFSKKSGNPVVRLTDQGVLKSVNAPFDAADVFCSQDNTAKVIAQETAEVEDPKRFLTEEILLSGSNAKMAELVAREIYDIRESRNLITRGQADYIPADGESAKYILQQLDVQEQSLLSMFTGTNSTETVEYTFECNPDSSVSRQILFRFSSRLGVLEADNLAGEPIWIDVENQTVAQAERPVSKQQPLLYYKVPGTAKIRIYDNRRVYAGTSAPFAQFGYTAAIAQSMFGKGKAPVLIFNTLTGALESVSE